jgi:hypothetical protein
MTKGYISPGEKYRTCSFPKVRVGGEKQPTEGNAMGEDRTKNTKHGSRYARKGLNHNTEEGREVGRL